MSRKIAILPTKILAGGDMSQATITSDPARLQIDYTDNVAMQLNWTGSPTGTFDFQGSIDGVNWVSLPVSNPVAASGSGSSALVTFNQVPFHQLRAVYTKTSGTGSLDIWVEGKAV